VIPIVLKSIFGGAALLLFVAGYLRRPARLWLWSAAGSAACATAAAHYDAFWPMTAFGAIAAAGLLLGSNVMDLAWRARAALSLALTLFGFLALWPSLETISGGRMKCPAYVKERVDFRLVAGLDLRGGLRLVYTVDVDEAIKDKRDHYYEDMRAQLARAFELHSGDDRPSQQVLEKLREKVDLVASRAEPSLITLRVKNPADAGKIDDRFLNLYRGDLDHKVKAGLHELRMRESVATAIRDRAVGQAKEIIHRRIDELGLREAAVSTRDEDIIIEVPGQDEKSFTMIKEIIGQTARLEFKLLDDEADFFGEVQKKLGRENLPELGDWGRETVQVGLDAQGEIRTKQISYLYVQKKDAETSAQCLQRAKEWASQLDLPPDRELGYELVRETDPDALDPLQARQKEAGWRTYFLKSRAEITGDLIRDASAQPDPSGAVGGWHVALTFTDQGGSIFGRITGENVKRRFAIILDDRIESAPVIRQAILGGNASITMGSADPDSQLRDARKLELVLRSGALPAPISPTNEQSIGPSLGQDSIKLGVQGSLGGGLLVMLLVLLYYRRAGFIADFALLMNMFFQLAILATFGASMTLPGIAGLALTMGMSVDANILINERIKEELRDGKSARAAVELGYDRAFSAILDGNLTVVIAGLVMMQYGSGPIKGFAVTLMIGVMCSLFTAVTLTRLFFDIWVRRMGRTARLDIG
jgi:preprotein translocase subunit SecD